MVVLLREANEEMDYAPAASALCAAARRGVDVKVVMTDESDCSSAFGWLRGCGVQLHLYHGQAYYIHAKLLLVDGREALVSSQNLSTGSPQYNRELGITVTARPSSGRLQAISTPTIGSSELPGARPAHQ